MISSCYQYAADMNNIHYEGSHEAAGLLRCAEASTSSRPLKPAAGGLTPLRVGSPWDQDKWHCHYRCSTEATSRMLYPGALTQTIKLTEIS